MGAIVEMPIELVEEGENASRMLYPEMCNDQDARARFGAPSKMPPLR